MRNEIPTVDFKEEAEVQLWGKKRHYLLSP